MLSYVAKKLFGTVSYCKIRYIDFGIWKRSLNIFFLLHVKSTFPILSRRYFKMEQPEMQHLQSYNLPRYCYSEYR